MSTFIKGDAIILYIYDGVSFRPIACLTSNALSQTRNIIESQTKCYPGVVIKDAGSLSYEISFEGQYIDTTSVGSETTKASHDYLFGVITAGSDVEWEMDTGFKDVVSASKTIKYKGTGIFSDLELNADAGDELANFSGTISGSGVIDKVTQIELP